MLAEELDAINAIYSNDDEFEVLCKGDGVLDTVLKIQVACSDVSPPIHITAMFTLSPAYPSVSPEILVYCERMTREQAELLKAAVLDYTQSLIGQPMIMDIVQWIEHNIGRYLVIDKGNSADHRSSTTTSLLHIDHMRAKGRYIKTIQKWTADFRLSGRLIFNGSLIFLLLQGNREDIKDFTVRLKTVKIDVDSKGRSCKERMMKVVAEEELDDSHERMSDFQVIEASSMGDVHNIFAAASLESLFEQHMLPFYKKS